VPLKSELDRRFATFEDDVAELKQPGTNVAEEEVGLVLGQYFGVAFRAIGALIVAVGEIAEHIDTLESRN